MTEPGTVRPGTVSDKGGKKGLVTRRGGAQGFVDKPGCRPYLERPGMEAVGM